MTDSSGAVRLRNDFAPYGVVTKIVGDLDCQWAFTGHFYDPAYDLHLTLFRAYDQATGKWLSPDPIRESGGLLVYGYALNKPIKLADPLGLDVWIQDAGMVPGHLEIAIGDPTRTFKTFSLVWALDQGIATGVVMVSEGRPGTIYKNNYAYTTQDIDEKLIKTLMWEVETSQSALYHTYIITHKNCRGWARETFATYKRIIDPNKFVIINGGPEKSTPGSQEGIGENSLDYLTK
jgi:RHS repeat-associated protein